MSIGSLQVTFRDLRGKAAPPAGEGELILRASVEADGGRRQLSMDVVERGLDALTTGPGEPVTLVLSSDPTLDDMLAAEFAARLVSHTELPDAAKAFARYAALLREGLEASGGPLSESLEGLYLALRADAGTLADNANGATLFLKGWARLADVLWPAMQEDQSPTADSLFSGRAEFSRERAFLQRDEEVYRQDVLRGERWLIALPGGPKEASGLLLRQPKSVLFKHWARHDGEAPVGDTYLLLLVTNAPGSWILSTDPIQRLSLAPLAGRLQEAELKVSSAAAGDPWFDGASFDHTLIASPRAGSKLSDSTLLKTVKSWLRSKPAPSRNAADHRAAVLAIAGASVVIAVLVIIASLFMGSRNPGISRQARPQGAGIQSRDLVDFRKRTPRLGKDEKDTIRKEGMLRTFALFVCVKHSKMSGDLLYPCKDARALYDLLKRRYGLDPKDTILLGDNAQALHGIDYRKPNKDTFWNAVNELGERIKAYGLKSKDKNDVVPDSNLLVFLAGHGYYDKNKSTKKDKIGYFVLSDCWEKSLDHTLPNKLSPLNFCLPMTGLAKNLKTQSGAKHVLLILDSCFSGLAGNYKGEAIATVGDIFRERTHNSFEIIMAGTRDQKSHEHPTMGNSIFAKYLLEGLDIDVKKPRAACKADSEPDGLLTAGELHYYLLKNVPQQAKNWINKTTEQIPQYNRGKFGDGIGQFILVPNNAVGK